LGEISGLSPGDLLFATGKSLEVKVGKELLGRVLNGLGKPIDGGELPNLKHSYPVHNTPPNPLSRRRISQPLPTGIRAIDGLLTIGKGQRIGIFSGSGVGKSTLLGMIARNTKADVNVIALVGERGREVKEFLERDLGEEGLKRSVVVVETGDKPPLLRIKAALVATAIAEFFRDEGYDVMLMMDSLTRVALSLREVGLAVGEPPTTRGYTPTVFSFIPKLVERAGTSSKGSITGLYSVLVEGDDINEPVSDVARGTLDGHIILSRELANKQHFPAIDVLGSISRVMPDVVDEHHLSLARELKELIAEYKKQEDLITLGAYKTGTNEKVDRAIRLLPKIEEFLKQGIYEKATFEETLKSMEEILNS